MNSNSSTQVWGLGRQTSSDALGLRNWKKKWIVGLSCKPLMGLMCMYICASFVEEADDFFFFFCSEVYAAIE